MSSETVAVDAPQQSGFEPYRAVSKPAVLALACGAIAVPGLLIPGLLIFGVAGIALGLLAWRSISRYPDELTGQPVAIAGLVLSLAVFLAGTVRHGYIFATEVPEGYQRISFVNLQPPKNSGQPIPPEALQLDEQKVFVKGYVYPDGQQYNIQRFVLVPDMGTCCFGGQPKLTDMIEVTLEEPLRIEYSMRKRKLAGLFNVDTQLKAIDGLGGVYYQLQADYRK